MGGGGPASVRARDKSFIPASHTNRTRVWRLGFRASGWGAIAQREGAIAKPSQGEQNEHV